MKKSKTYLYGIIDKSKNELVMQTKTYDESVDKIPMLFYTQRAAKEMMIQMELWYDNEYDVKVVNVSW